MEIKGYALIKIDAEGTSPVPMDSFQGKICRIIDIAVDESSFLIIDPKATGICDIAKTHVKAFFRCSQIGDILTPPGMDISEQMLYASKVMSRKGGYSPILKHLVIGSSLHRREFSDNVLWAKQ